MILRNVTRGMLERAGCWLKQSSSGVWWVFDVRCNFIGKFVPGTGFVKGFRVGNHRGGYRPLYRVKAEAAR